MSKDPQTSELITLKEAAEYSGLSADYLRDLARKGRLRASKVGMQWLTTRRAVNNYLATRQKRGAYRNDIRA